MSDEVREEIPAGYQLQKDVDVLFVNFNGLDPIDVRMRGRLEHFDLPLHYRKLISSSLPAQHLLAGVLRERLCGEREVHARESAAAEGLREHEKVFDVRDVS